MKIRVLWISGLMLAATAGQVQAAFVTANATIDLNAAITGNAWTGYAHALDSTVSVTSGDTVTINIDFLNNQTLTWNSSGYFSPWLMLDGYPGGITDSNQSGSFNWSGLSVNLVDLTQGTQFPVSQLVDGTSGSIHLGPTFTLGADSVLRTFSGVSLSFLATWDDGDAFREYSTIGYEAYGGLFSGENTIGESSAVPEPAAIAMWGLGAVGLVFAARKRRQMKLAA